MLLLNEIQEDYSIRKQVVETEAFSEDTEMSEHDSAFLCGLLKSVQPRKILEVGVAGGGTTAIVLQCLECIGNKYEMYSVDINNFYYRKPEKECGYLADAMKRKLIKGTHNFLLGKGIGHYIDVIGQDIDFIILDTTHVLPGEILDFLVLLPMLSDEAVVCLHDIALMQYHSERSFCTALLNSAVVANKIINLKDKEVEGKKYPNIGAFQINEGTKKNIINLFTALTFRWYYFPSYVEMKRYNEIIHNNYDEKICAVYDEAVEMNARSFYYNYTGLSDIVDGSRLVIYGAGIIERTILGIMKYTQRASIVGCVDKNYKVMEMVDGIAVFSPQDIGKIGEFDYVVIAMKSSVNIKEATDVLERIGISKEKIKTIY